MATYIFEQKLYNRVENTYLISQNLSNYRFNAYLYNMSSTFIFRALGETLAIYYKHMFLVKTTHH